jgi:hypothetical protein
VPTPPNSPFGFCAGDVTEAAYGLSENVRAAISFMRDQGGDPTAK